MIAGYSANFKLLVFGHSILQLFYLNLLLFN